MTCSPRGLLDLDGNLVGVIVPCPERVAAVADVEILLLQGQTLEGRFLRRCRLLVDLLTEAGQEHRTLGTDALPDRRTAVG